MATDRATQPSRAPGSRGQASAPATRPPRPATPSPTAPPAPSFSPLRSSPARTAPARPGPGRSGSPTALPATGPTPARSTPLRATPTPRRPLPYAPEMEIRGHAAAGIPKLLLVGLLLLLLGVVGVFQVLQSSETARVGYEFAALESERQQLSAEVRLLEADVARLSRLDEVRRLAEEELGMVEPERTVRVPVSASAPDVVPLPERYVAEVPAFDPREPSWRDRFLRALPGVD